MKKILAILLVLAICLAGFSAFAAETSGRGDTIARNGELAAFMDGNGSIYVSGLAKPVNSTPAEKVLSIDPYRIVYFAKANPDAGIPASRLISLELDSFAETIASDDVYAACVDGDNVFYISASDRTQLFEMVPGTRMGVPAFTAAEPLERVYKSGAGVIVTLVDGAGAYIQDSVTGAFLPYNGDIAAEIAIYDGFELFLTDSRKLYLQEDGVFTDPLLVDSSVQDWAVIGNTIYYLSGSASNLTLKSYNLANGLWSIILRPSQDMESQLTASENALFMLSKGGTIYSVDVKNGKLVGFATLPALSSYALGNGKTLDSYRIEAVSGQLNVYGIINDSNTLPTFTFVDFSSQIVEDTSSELMLLSAYAISGESTVWDLLQPAEQFSTLRKGSRGDAVSAIQQPLYDAKYYNYYIDGIFGWRTENAIRLLQADLGEAVNGIADADLQRFILSGNMEAYDPYKQLKRGDSGYRVMDMQERLRDLGYLADEADGIYGRRTESAVLLFQEENDLNETGSADSKTLERLFSDKARTCSSYIDLYPGDRSYRVRELNKRLKALYYLEGDVGSSYNAATRAAVIRFQDECGLTQNGGATVKVQQKLFSKNAPEYSGYISLQRGDNNDRVEEMQNRLTDLGYHAGRSDGYFDKVTRESVKKFQRAIGVKATGIADPDTLEALFSKDAPEYREPVMIGTPVIELNAYSRYQDGFYFISDSVTTDGGVTVSWFADGDVASYDIRITDASGKVYLEDSGMDPLLNIASIPVTSLDPENNYTITVTANPANENDKPTTASIRFIRVLEEPEPDDGEIGEIGKLIITPVGENISREDGMYLIPGETLHFAWSADGAVAGYDYVLTDGNGNVFISNSGVSDRQEAMINADELDSDRVYVLIVYAVPTNGTMDDATWDSISFRIQKDEPEVTPEPTQDPVIPDSPDGTPEEPDTSEEPVITPEPTVEVTPEPIVTPEPTEETPEASEEPTEEPDPITVGVPQLSVEPYEAVSEVEIEMSEGVFAEVLLYDVYEGDIALYWPADGASHYDVCITGSVDGILVNQRMDSISAGFNTSAMIPGEIYTMTVTAYAADDDSVTESAMFCFRLPVQAEEEIIPAEEEYYEEETAVEEPAEEEFYEEEPVVEEPAEEEFYEEEPVVEEPAEEEFYEEEPVVEEPAEEEFYEEEPVVEEPAEEEFYEEEPTVEEPAEEEFYEEEPVVEEPVAEEPVVEEPYYPTDDPSAWTSVISVDSDPEAIKVIQQRLREWKWLEKGSFTKGELDEATVAAIVLFQEVCAEYGLNLEPCDPSNPLIDTDTLWLLFNADGTEFINPYA